MSESNPPAGDHEISLRDPRQRVRSIDLDDPRVASFVQRSAGWSGVLDLDTPDAAQGDAPSPAAS